MSGPPRSAYVHIPFCHRRCFYCDFSIVPIGDNVDSIQGNGRKIIKDYLKILIREILSIKHKSPLSTIYIGGGTPSILDPTQIAEIIKTFKIYYGIDYGAEITMEVDPASFVEKDLYGFIKAGVNRFSLGAQSFNNIILKQAGRRHTTHDVEQSCLWLKRAKKKNYIKSWSLDLIQNLPRSVLSIWREDLEKTISFDPPHISIYDLNIEDGTVFQRLQDLGKLSLPNQDESFENSQITSKILNDSGYARYEISNYSLPGHQSRHNRVYWQGFGWWSFGQGSTSSPWGIRFSRPKTSSEYKQWVGDQCNKELEKSLLEEASKNLDLDEKIMLGLRLKEGVNIRKLFEKESWDEETSEIFMSKLLAIWQKYRDSNLLKNEGDRFFLSDPQGMELSNQILISMFSWWEQINED
tara:strand:+ start:244 stop:1473 length:1230 start_codon:yes stop_codon:yes gene_type:complete